MDKDPLLGAVMVDGVELKLPEPAATIVGKAMKALAEARVAIAWHQEEAVDGTIAIDKLIGEVAALKAQLKTADVTPAIDVLVEDRMAIVAKAKGVLGDRFDIAGKSDADIRRAVVATKLGDAVTKILPAAAIEGAFAAVTVTEDNDAGNGRRSSVNGRGNQGKHV